MAENVDSSTSVNVEESASDEAALSMLDVLADEKKLEEDANAVLGDSDDRNCTYYMGYVSRQALYSCLTCIKPEETPGGVCLACCLECHEGHDLVELYTKRNFRCDCGNSKFGDFKCKLSANKAEKNEDNKYNQNFVGKYCTCGRPYPDPEEEVEDDMLQCIVCEDWFHGRHLKSSVPEDEDYDEMICPTCMTKCDFLWPYAVVSGDVSKLEKSDNSEPVSVESSPQKEATATSKPDGDTTSTPSASQDKVEAGTSQSSIAAPPATGACKREELTKRDLSKHSGATFWPEKWRQKLCKCAKCMTLYDSVGVSFLLDESDSIKAYEDRGKRKAAAAAAGGSQYEGGLQALSGLDRLQQVEMLHGYNDMKSELTDYLKKFAENGKVVREEDIKEFFQQLASRKRQKTAAPMQYFCK